MQVTKRALIGRISVWASALLIAAGPAWAQVSSITHIRGTIESVDAQGVTVTTRSGEHLKIALAENLGVTWIAPIAVEAIKPGSFIGTAAMPQADGTLQAREIQVFPEAMRGVGEGHRPWDLEAGSTMTNGTVGDLKVANGRTLRLAYKGGEKTVYVPPSAPVITFEPADRSALKPGAHVIVTARQAADASLTATRIGVGKGGLVPPM